MDLPDPDELLGRLSIWASEQRAEDAKLERERARHEREIALDEMRLSGLLRDTYESQTELVVITKSDERISGFVTETGSDYVAVGTPGYGSTLVTVEAIDRVEVSKALTPTDRSLSATRALSTALDEYCGLRVRLGLLSGNDAIAGELEGVGGDIIAIITDKTSERRAFVPISRIATLSVSN